MNRVRQLLVFFVTSLNCYSQELFINTEPASNIPARSVNLKLSGQFIPYDPIYHRPGSRYTGRLQFGISKKLMAQTGLTFSNMYSNRTEWEASFLQMKYRFLSFDKVHEHFRMAAFASASKSKAPFHYNESNLLGDKSGVELGIIATQLLNKFALSATLSNLQILDESRYDNAIYLPMRSYSFINYSISTGYLLLPREYSSYRQVNLNIYLEALGQQALNQNRFYLDLAPAIQLIFFSNTKLNIGSRFQFKGNIQRMSNESWSLSMERSFLNVIKQRKK